VYSAVFLDYFILQYACLKSPTRSSFDAAVHFPSKLWTCSSSDPYSLLLPNSIQLIEPQAALAEQEQTSAALAVVEVSARVLLQGRIYEESFTAEKLDLTNFVGKDCLERFNKDLVHLYVVILRSLAHILRVIPKHGVKQAIHAIYNPGATKARLNEINEAEIVLLTQVHICNTRVSYTSLQSVERQLQGLQSQLLTLNGDKSSMLDWRREAKHGDILRWCSCVSFGDHHYSVSSRRTKGTGEWLLQRYEFIGWLNSPSNSVLLLYGIRTFNPLKTTKLERGVYAIQANNEEYSGCRKNVFDLNNRRLL
jgi:hypothetical protein